jgi:hypothetical protein
LPFLEQVEEKPIKLYARVHYDPKRWFGPGDLRAEIGPDGLKIDMGNAEWRRARPGSGSEYRGRNFLTADLGDRVIEISLEALTLNTHQLAQDLSAFLNGQRGPLDPAGYAIGFDDKLWTEIIPRLAWIRPPAGFVLAFFVLAPFWLLYVVAGFCLRPLGSRRWSVGMRVAATLVLGGAFLASCPCGFFGIATALAFAPMWQHWPTVALGDSATVDLPGTSSTRTLTPPVGPKVTVVESRTKGLHVVNYAAAVVELQPGQVADTPDAAFEQVAGLRVELIDKCCDEQHRREPPRLTKGVTLAGRYPGLERRFDTDGYDSKSRLLDGQLAERCYLVNGRVYVLVVFRNSATPTKPAEFERFLDSLQVAADK